VRSVRCSTRVPDETVTSAKAQHQQMPVTFSFSTLDVLAYDSLPPYRTEYPAAVAAFEIQKKGAREWYVVRYRFGSHKEASD
jgi:hypothetical protein